MFYSVAQKTQSELENRFLADCVTVGLIVESQYLIERIHADFAIPSKRIVIEIDSKQYHSSDKAHEIDRSRDNIYLRNGWTVIRITGYGVMRRGEEIAYEIKRGDYDNLSDCVTLN